MLHGVGIISPASNTSSFNVLKHSTPISIDFNQTIFVGDNVIVNVTLPEDINDVINFNIAGNNYILNLTDGKTSFNYTPLTNDTVNIIVSFSNFSAISRNLRKVVPTDITSISFSIGNLLNLSKYAF